MERSESEKGYLSEADELVFLLEEVPRKLRRLFDASTARLGLSRTQWRALGYIYRTPGLTQTELSKHLDMERASVGHIIDHLERANFVERRATEGNRRVWALHLLPKAIEILPSLRIAADGIYDRLLAGVAEADEKAIRNLLVVMSANLEN